MPSPTYYGGEEEGGRETTELREFSSRETRVFVLRIVPAIRIPLMGIRVCVRAYRTVSRGSTFNRIDRCSDDDATKGEREGVYEYIKLDRFFFLSFSKEILLTPVNNGIIIPSIDPNFKIYFFERSLNNDFREREFVRDGR